MRLSGVLAQDALRTGTPLLAGIYDRVSNDPTGRRRSVDQQNKRNHQVCQDKGWLVPDDGVYCDNDRSASRFASKPRPDWDRLRADVETRRRHVVVLWEVSRGDRDDLDWIGFLHDCRKIGVLIHITSHRHTYDPRMRRDYKTLAEEGLDSADESERTSERIRRDTEDMADQGRPHGPVLYGYRREYSVDEHGHRHIAGQYFDDEPQTATARDGSASEYTRAGIVREIFRRVLAGETARGIAADLNQRGIPTPRNGATGWRASTVRNVVLNAAYAGIRVHKGRRAAEAIWPALVKQSDYYTLMGRFSTPERRSQRDGGVKHMGSGLYVCGMCRRVVRPGRNGKEIPCYVCWPSMVLPAAAKKRKVTEDELAGLRGLGVREQSQAALDLVRSGVTQVSIARGLGLHPAAFGWRVRDAARRRGEEFNSTAWRAQFTQGEYLEQGAHVVRAMQPVDDHVERSVWLRLLKPDLVEMLQAEESRSDKQVADLTAEITEKQLRLDQARDSYAAGGLSLEGLLRVEATLEPEIKAARSRLNQARVGPVLEGLLVPTLEEVQAEWGRRSIPQRREVIRALIERVEILPLRDRRRFTIEESVRIVWRGERDATVTDVLPTGGDPV